jgi:glycine cleavage system H protein
MKVPEDCRYTHDHEWARVEGDVVVVGLTDYAQDQLGEIVYVDLSEAGAEVEAGGALGVVESTKSVSDVMAPVAGEVAEVNEVIVDAPELVNTDPYGEGWLVKIRSASDLGELLDAAAYTELTGEDGA